MRLAVSLAMVFGLTGAALAAAPEPDLAYAAYQRAQSPADEAAALALLGQAYAAQELWRPALNAYAASLKVRVVRVASSVRR